MKLKVICILIAAASLLAVGILAMVVTRLKTKINTNKIAFTSIDDVPREYWSKLAEKIIFFGHQSVGFNIIDGIIDIINERDYIELNIIESCEQSVFDRPVFAHSQVGMNTKPFSKIKRFEEIMNSGLGSKVDIAFFKFCYVDIMKDSDPREIFDGYSAAIKKLKNQYPETTFLHVTVPIRSAPMSIKKILKQSVKLIIGKPGIMEDNMVRQCYNKLLTTAYSETEPLFDLALIESVNTSGFCCYISKGMENVCVMSPEYTKDGGHLNILGRWKVAEQLLIILAELSGRS
jgi:hypothetical protein